MKLDVPLRHLGVCPIGDIAAALPPANDPVWDRFAKRQKDYSVHLKTRSIGFLWTDGWVSGAPLTIDLGYAPDQLAQAVRAAGETILAHYPGGKILRLMLTELVAGGSIPRHRDSSEMLETVHRCHVAVVTNPNVTFSIDDVDYHLPAGEVYEFDNMRPHSVANGGEERRIHLICNILPPQTIS